mmetsp:Transcript_34292/g.47708  ORF Transcript_34292/g.47708 Transcript_34292/m.47708 type:complete len:250 (+) Transcript_34292:2785-3534(+)
MIYQKVIKNASYFSKFVVRHRRNRRYLTKYGRSYDSRFLKSYTIKSKKFRSYLTTTNTCITGVITFSSLSGDTIVAKANSRDLLKFGLSYGRKNLINSYFVGLLLAKKTITEFKLYKSHSLLLTVDIGFKRLNEKGRINAFIKGLIDGGIQIPVSQISKTRNSSGEKELNSYFSTLTFIPIKKYKKNTYFVGNKSISEYLTKIYMNILKFSYIKQVTKSYEVLFQFKNYKSTEIEKKATLMSKIFHIFQ